MRRWKNEHRKVIKLYYWDLVEVCPPLLQNLGFRHYQFSNPFLTCQRRLISPVVGPSLLHFSDVARVIYVIAFSLTDGDNGCTFAMTYAQSVMLFSFANAYTFPFFFCRNLYCVLYLQIRLSVRFLPDFDRGWDMRNSGGNGLISRTGAGAMHSLMEQRAVEDLAMRLSLLASPGRFWNSS